MTKLMVSPRRGLARLFNRRPLTPLHDDMEDLFERFWGAGDGWNLSATSPPLDLSETDSAIRIGVDVPGLDPQDIDIQVNGNHVTISGERKECQEEQGETFHRTERRVGAFSRSVWLPCAIDESKVDAQYRNGVLHITLPKAEEAKSKRIEVHA